MNIRVNVFDVSGPPQEGQTPKRVVLVNCAKTGREWAGVSERDVESTLKVVNDAVKAALTAPDPVEA